MTLLLNLSDVEARSLRHYLTSVAVTSVRSSDFIPDVVFKIIGQLHVDLWSHLENESDESSKESVSNAITEIC
mgnify:CR=1 FL=1